MGKVIYKPTGKASEYAEWACNFYVGCNNGCDYCYLKKGRGAKILGGSEATLKKCFKDESHALDIFEKELTANITELREHGLFFSFTTDPMLKKTWLLTMNAMNICHVNDVPVKILTKCAWWVDRFIQARGRHPKDSRPNQLTAFGFTLTGHDELEQGASTNAERVEAMSKLNEAGFKTFASIEPIIDIESSSKMIFITREFCDLYKVGLESGRKYDWRELRELIQTCAGIKKRFYFKDSFIKQAKISREDLPENCVPRHYQHEI